MLRSAALLGLRLSPSVVRLPALSPPPPPHRPRFIRHTPTDNLDSSDDHEIGLEIAKPAIRKGAVYLVATPIGNLADITYRAVQILQDADIIASEDTRRTGFLLNQLGLGKKHQVSHHKHNWKTRVPELIRCAQEGKSIAVVSDAGTPGISDPGTEFVNECIKHNIQVIPVAGACAAVCAVSVSGLQDTTNNEFVFVGFLPPKGSPRHKKIQEIVDDHMHRAVVLYESPHRITRTLKDLLEAHSPSHSHRSVMVAKEITKLHETFYRGTLEDASSWYDYSID